MQLDLAENDSYVELSLEMGQARRNAASMDGSSPSAVTRPDLRLMQCAEHDCEAVQAAKGHEIVPVSCRHVSCLEGDRL